MNRILRSFTKVAVLALAIGSFSGAAYGQFVILTQDDDTIEELRNGSNLVFQSEGVGDVVRRRVTIQFTGPDDSTLLVNEPAVAGSTTFSAAAGPTLPVILNSGESIDFTITFDPTGDGPFSGRFELSLVQADRFRPFDTTTNLLINLTGQVAAYTLSYQLPGGNQLLVPDGGALPFDDTQVDASMSAAVTVTNRGSGPGTVESVAVSGSPIFEAVGLTLLPVTVPAGQTLRFNIVFTPDQLGQFEGSATVNFGVGSRSFGLAGQGVAPLFTYEITTSEGSQTVADRGTVTLPAVDVDQELEAQVRVTNRGSLEGVITRIAVAGAGFRVTDLPIIPAELDVNESFDFTLSFTPAEPGEVNGQLQIGDSRFTVVGIGSGPVLSYSAISPTSSVEVEPRGTIVFPQTPLGELGTVRVEITNSGNQAQPISLIAVSGASYSLKNLPPLPTTLATGQTIGFDVQFEPQGSGPQQGSLSVDSTSFTLSGAGAAPPELSLLTIEGVGGAVDPAQQIPLTVRIAETYPVDIAGTLSIAFDSAAFSNDPSVQFETGGRTAAFRIFAGETEAVFANGARRVRFQTGTVAGQIEVTAQVETLRGRVDLTPEEEPTLTYSLAPGAPQLRRAALGNSNNAGFSVLVTGFATSRQISTLQLNLTAAPDAQLTTTTLTADVADAFNAWYQSNQSTGFGSQFTATVTLSVDGNPDDIASIQVSASNGSGSSNAVTLDLTSN